MPEIERRSGRIVEPRAIIGNPIEILMILSTVSAKTWGVNAVTASGGWFIQHELLGNKNVKLYDGSMHEWTLEKRPVKEMVME